MNDQPTRRPSRKGKLTGQKAPFRLSDIYAIRSKLELAKKTRDIALFDLGIDSKLRGCDLVSLRVRDISHGGELCRRAVVRQKKTQPPVQFEITERTRIALKAWIEKAGLSLDDYLFPSRIRARPHISARHYCRIVKGWVRAVGLDAAGYATHSLRRTKATLIYRRTHNLRAIQLLLGHTKIESTVRYLGVELDDALEIAERTEA